MRFVLLLVLFFVPAISLEGQGYRYRNTDMVRRAQADIARFPSLSDAQLQRWAEWETWLMANYRVRRMRPGDLHILPALPGTYVGVSIGNARPCYWNTGWYRRSHERVVNGTVYRSAIYIRNRRR